MKIKIHMAFYKKLQSKIEIQIEKQPKKLLTENVLGNECQKLLDNLHVLEQVINRHTRSTRKRKNESVQRQAFLTCFQTFKTVVDKCFGKDLEPGWVIALEDFKCAYRALEISITTKVHLVFEHVEDFCKMNRCGLGAFSEHAFESVHRDFADHWARHLVKDKSNPRYWNKLMQTICEYNAGHI